MEREIAFERGALLTLFFLGPLTLFSLNNVNEQNVENYKKSIEQSAKQIEALKKDLHDKSTYCNPNPSGGILEIKLNQNNNVESDFPVCDKDNCDEPGPKYVAVIPLLSTGETLEKNFMPPKHPLVDSIN